MLVHNQGFQWATRAGVYFKGYFFCDKGKYYKGEDACVFFGDVEPAQIVELLRSLNGSFALLIDRDGCKIAATDRLRSIPLFYIKNDDGFFIGDDTSTLISQSRLPKEVEQRSLNEFLLSGFVIGDHTLIKGLKQLRAGEALIYNADRLRVVKYYRHMPSTVRIGDINDEFETLKLIGRRWCDRLLHSAEGRQVVIPLSGGYDSRYIAAELVNRGATKIVTYTYGARDSEEVLRSKKVSDALGLDWHFVEYTEQKYRDFIESDAHDRYINYSHQHSSTPHYQEFIALNELTQAGVIDKNAIVVPGFCGDFLGGSYVPLEAKIGEEDRLLEKGLVKHVIDKQLYLKIFLQDRVDAEVKKHVEAELMYIAGNCVVDTTQKFVAINDAFFAEHKIAKYVINSLRVYEFFNLEWRMPLWDNELHEYWYNIPYGLKGESPLYNRFLTESLFKPLEINFSRPPSGGTSRLERALIKTRFLRKHAEKIILIAHGLNSIVNRKDDTAFEIPKMIYLEEMYGKRNIQKIQTKNLAAVLTRWIVFKRYDSEKSRLPVSPNIN